MTIIETAAELLDMVVKAEIIHDETIAEAIARAERAEAALAERDKPCVWKYTEVEREPWGVLATYYHTACDHIEHSMPDLADLPYCPFCGHPIQIAPSDNDLLSPDQEDR